MDQQYIYRNYVWQELLYQGLRISSIHVFIDMVARLDESFRQSNLIYLHIL